MDSLLLSRDDQVIKFFCRVLNDMGIEVEVCSGSERAQEQIQHRKFDALVIDCDDVHGGPEVLRSIRSSPSNRSSTAFALTHGVTSVHEAFAMGANLALEKPISLDRARRSFRAVQGLMLMERRRFFRFPIDVPVTLTVQQQPMQAQMTDLSAGGMAVRARSPLAAGKMLVSARFTLPGSQTWVSVQCSVCWADEKGNAGLRFENPPYVAREQLEHWLSKQIEEEQAEKKVFAIAR